MHKGFFIIVLLYSFFLTQECIAQPLTNKINFKKSNIVNGYPETTVVSESDSSSGLWLLIPLEGAILGYSYLSIYTWGAYFIGASYVGGSAFLAGVLVYQFHQSEPGFTIPYMVGCAALGYYNIRYAKSHPKKRKFWTNFTGFHATIIISGLSETVVKKFTPKNIAIQSGHDSIGIIYKF